MSFRWVLCVCAFGAFLSIATARGGHAEESNASGSGTLLDRVRALASSARTGLIVQGRLERTAPATPLPSEPEAAFNELAHLLESEGMQLLDGPADMRVAVQREHASAWPSAFPESTWVRERCRTGEPMIVHFGIVGAEPRDIAGVAAHLTRTEFADKNVIPAIATPLTILAERSYSLVEGCQIYEAALLLAGFEIEQQGGVFTIRRTR